MSYTDLNAIHNPSPGTTPPAEWGDQVRDNFEAVVNPPRAKVRRTATQDVASGAADTEIEFTSVDWDVGGMFNPNEPERLTVPSGWGGLWVVMVFGGSWSNNPNGVRQFHVFRNGTDHLVADVRAGDNSSARGAFSVEVELAEGDYLVLLAGQNSGSTLTISHNSSANHQTWMSARWIGVAAA